MKKTTFNFAVTLLLSLGVVACGSKKHETVVNAQPNIDAAELAALKRNLNDAQATSVLVGNQKAALQAELDEAETKLGTLQAALAQAKSANGVNVAELEEKVSTAQTRIDTLKRQLSEANERLSALEKELEQAKSVNVEAAVSAAKQAVRDETAFVRQSGSQITQEYGSQGYKILNENDKASLSSVVQSAPNIEEAVARTFAATLEKGTVMAANNRSYAGYAVVREAYDKDDRSLPANSYIYSVHTPTTDLSKVQNVSATYKGSASYSAKNGTPVVNFKTENAFTLNLDQNAVSGEIRNAPTRRNPEGEVVVSLNSAQVEQIKGVVGFKGEATFNETFAGTGANTGTYQGAFGGENAENVVGTFETGIATKEAGMQGAFIGTKQE